MLEDSKDLHAEPFGCLQVAPLDGDHGEVSQAGEEHEAVRCPGFCDDARAGIQLLRPVEVPGRQPQAPEIVKCRRNRKTSGSEPFAGAQSFRVAFAGLFEVSGLLFDYGYVVEHTGRNETTRLMPCSSGPRGLEGMLFGNKIVLSVLDER